MRAGPTSPRYSPRSRMLRAKMSSLRPTRSRNRRFSSGVISLRWHSSHLPGVTSYFASGGSMRFPSGVKSAGCSSPSSYSLSLSLSNSPGIQAAGSRIPAASAALIRSRRPPREGAAVEVWAPLCSRLVVRHRRPGTASG
ncbi:hypothetical protein PLESTB_001651800 [Pleodorina starrii]|uniref:Uncharacterized protein n=1 Tax=Pleodorina starrii TaxID=330485 RepID=A0A9W6BQW9_9CHLO|nr:hypothetical protein PLESTB_000991900 [Pleodorina starrii]GLC56270.1 hypothetical protein PLESTB_001086700 [Pleodorina starrii]GLC60646.1 hypothetical protein PLESTB_001651800 [Pleodorina starrii]GLC69614.1 hypothetical protein PLESTF_000855100 [Pleodorina starrii]GLC70333.1 hypothetical protein PLESTF_000960700 [Pleodorina starrii]